MAEHFPRFEGAITPMKLPDFLKWAAESNVFSENSLRLPPVQRSALWTPRQILDLWDTLLRGLPIGSFFLMESAAEKDCRAITAASETSLQASSKMEKSHFRGFDLLDGQQRMRTMLLANNDPKDEGRCLWIDPVGNDEGRAIRLRLTTSSQPFGYDENGAKLPLRDRGNARDEWNPDYEGADHEIFHKNIEACSAPPKPYKSPLAIRFGKVFSAWQSDRDNLAELIKIEIGDAGAPDDLKQFVERLDHGFRAFENAEVALIRVGTADAPVDPEDLLRLFDRIGAGGTPLTGEERLYSIYKHHEPYIFNAIESIRIEVGRVLPATKIAGCALRIATIETANNSFDLPDVSVFVKRMASDTDDLKNILRDLIPNDESDENWKNGRLAKAFSILISTIKYRGGDDCGIPHVMIPELAPDLVHVLAYWFYKHIGEENEITSDCRLAIVRFALFWQLSCFNDRKASRYALKYLKEATNSSELCFPGKSLYDLLTSKAAQDRCAVSLFDPEKMKDCNSSDTIDKLNPYWRSWKDRFEPASPLKECFRNWWQSRGKMLLWIQRAYFLDTFKSYDPCSGRDDDKPYDLDHFCARATWMNSIFPGNKDDNGDWLQSASNGRHLLGDGIGNLWWIDSRINKGLHDGSIVKKLEVAELQPVIAKSFEQGSLPLWRSASVNDKWNEAARGAFQLAVEKRTLWLYERFFKDLGFDEWLSPQIRH